MIFLDKCDTASTMVFTVGKCERSASMDRYTFGLGILVVAAMILTSCTTRPDYDETSRASVDAYFIEMQKQAELSKPLPKDSIYIDYESTKLNLTDNRDYNPNADYTPFVTRYDPDTKVNIGPGHVPKKTKWDSRSQAEVTISEQEPHFYWEDPKTGKIMHTRYSYLEDREVGPNHVYKKTKFDRNAKREIVEEDYDEGITEWCPVCKAEAGPGHDHDFTRYHETCQKDVAKWRHEQKGDIHYGHACGTTSYSKTWMIDMLNKDAKTYEKVPSSRLDYTELDKKFAPDSQPRIFEPTPPKSQSDARPENTMPAVPWVEDRVVELDKDALSKINWKWKHPKAEKMTFELAQRKVSDVAQDAIDLTEKARDPEYKWAKEKEKEQ
jgi:hypothetical protein